MADLARTAYRIAGSTMAAGAAAALYAGVIERNWFTLRRVTVPVLPAGADPITIMQVSDLHLVARQQRKIEWVRELARLRPDFVVNSGDNLSAIDAVPAALRALQPLMDVAPGAFVMGSNDYFGPVPKNPALYLTSRYAAVQRPRSELPVQELIDGMIEGGWRDLNNVRARAKIGGQDIELVGINDPHIGYDDYDSVAGPAATDAALTLGLVHAPYQRALDAIVSDGASLILAGHTHGGQLALPVYGAIVTNSDLDRSRAKGLSRWWPGAQHTPSSSAPADAAYLHVSAGIGTSPFAPFRFACRPEATLLTLTS